MSTPDILSENTVKKDRVTEFFDQMRQELETIKHRVKEGSSYEVLFNHFGAIHAVSKFGPLKGEMMQIEVYNKDEGELTLCFVPIEQANLLIHIFPSNRPTPQRRFMGFLPTSHLPAAV